MNQHTVVTVMLGMNRFTQKDTGHSFDMSALDGYNTMWMPEVSEPEKTQSTLFYEALHAINNLKNLDYKYKGKQVTKDDYSFIFGRGTFGPSQEERLFETLQGTMKYYGKDVNHIMIAKSFGVGDTLTALSMFKIYHKKPNINALFLIDGFLPPSRRRKIAKKINRKWRFKIPEFVDLCSNVVQRTQGFNGTKVVDDYNRFNFVVDQNYVNSHTSIYNGYSDGYSRSLSVCHFNMEEIVSANPCFSTYANMEVEGNIMSPRNKLFNLEDSIYKVIHERDRYDI